MKFTNFAILACAGYTTVQGQEEWDDEWDNNYGDDDEWDEEDVYTGEEERIAWIYGLPGDENYREEGTLDGTEIARLELMWEIDLEVQKKKGFFQGWHRGFYKDYDWEIGTKCFNRDSVAQMYYIKEIGSEFALNRFGELQGLFFNLYFMFDHECEIDDNLNDLANFCFDHDCSGETLL
jgi:hypothetical protein